MAGPRQPLEVLEANGRKHLSRAEREERRAGSVQGDGTIKRLTAPSWLPKGQREEFNRVAAAVVKLMPTLVARTDAEVIATYCMARQEWQTATSHANRELNAGRADEADAWSKIQERYFKQARACATDLGLTITSRCRISIPEWAREQPQETAFERLMREKQERMRRA